MASKTHHNDGDPLCPNCLGMVDPKEHFCPNCRAPLTVAAATDPLASVFATGHVYQKASKRPQSRVVLIGIWLLFGNLFIVNFPTFWFSLKAVLTFFIPSIGEFTNQGFVSMLLVFLFALGMETLCALVLYHVTKNYFKPQT